MSQPDQNLGVRWVPNIDDPKWDFRWATGGRLPAIKITVPGTNFGPPPPILLYMDWAIAKTDEPSTLVPIIGGAMSGVTGVMESWGHNGIMNRQGGTTNETNLPTQLTFVFPAPKRNFLVGFASAVPDGRYFSASAGPGVLPQPISSALKQVWLFDGPPDSQTKADIVIASWSGGNFALVGNQSPMNINHGGTFDFNGWNYYQGMAIAGADPFVDNGYAMAVGTNAVGGATINVRTNAPVFGAGADTAQYDRATFFGWSGSNNGNSTAMSLHTMDHIYIAASDDNAVSARIELTNNAVYASATKIRLHIPDRTLGSTLVWGDSTGTEFTVPWHLLQQGFTHWRVTTSTGQVFNGAIA